MVLWFKVPVVLAENLSLVLSFHLRYLLRMRSLWSLQIPAVICIAPT